MLAVLATLIGVPLVRSQQQTRNAPLPQVNNDSIEISPHWDDPRVITDEQLIRVLSRLQPRFSQPRPKINHVDHALRFWGLNAEFTCPDCLSGQQMRRVLTDHSTLEEAWGSNVRPLMEAGDYGVAVRTQLGPATSSHVDHTLATLAEVGTPLNFPIETAFGPSNQEDLFREAMRSFSLNQQEYEWTALAWALYAKDAQPWFTSEGQEMTFDRMAKRIMRQSYSQGVCYGNHRLYTLVVMLRVDSEKQILSEPTQHRIRDFLASATSQLVSTQSPEGYWDETWAGDAQPLDSSDAASVLSRRLLVTGHSLEWWALAPEELLPPRDVVIRAAQWLVKSIDSMSDEQISTNYTFLSHAGRALALWRMQTPEKLTSRLIDNQGASP